MNHNIENRNIIENNKMPEIFQKRRSQGTNENAENQMINHNQLNSSISENRNSKNI